MWHSLSYVRIGVFGAGAIGCYLGGRIASDGHEVVAVGRDRLRGEVEAHGLTTVDLDGARRRVAASERTLSVATSPEALADCDAVLVTVKSKDTRAAGEALAAVLREDVEVVSFQNGVRNADVLAACMPKQRVLRGMVSFNVLWEDRATFRQATSGPIAIDPCSSALRRALDESGLPLLVCDDMRGVQWGKLVINLNNALCALSGLPLKDELLDRDYRRILAGAQDEALAVARALGIEPRRVGMLIPTLAPRVLRLPTWLFVRVATQMLKVEPDARSSMHDDLDRRHRTEIDELNGLVAEKGRELGIATPVNDAIAKRIREAEAAEAGSPRLAAREIVASIGTR